MSVIKENWSSVGKRVESSSSMDALFPSSAAKGSECALSIMRRGEGLGFADPWCDTGLIGLPRRIGSISGMVGGAAGFGGDKVAPVFDCEFDGCGST